jgi:hypothetical protein
MKTEGRFESFTSRGGLLELNDNSLNILSSYDKLLIDTEIFYTFHNLKYIEIFSAFQVRNIRTRHFLTFTTLELIYTESR